MDYYQKVVGKTELFDAAPPMAEVVLEVIGEDKFIYAEAFKPGAAWWHPEGHKARRGLMRENLSDYYCAASRELRRSAIDELKQKQRSWELMHDKTSSISLQVRNLSREDVIAFKDRMSKEKTELFLPTPSPMLEECFISVLNPPSNDNWIRINTAGRIKFSEALMFRYDGIKVDVAMSPSGTIRVCEVDLGRLMNHRGYISARRLAGRIDFNGQASVVAYLEERQDGCLYGRLKLKDGEHGTEVD